MKQGNKALLDKLNTGLAAVKGDIARMKEVLALGVDPQDMYLTLARDLARNADHAVLIVRQGDRFFLLDNSTDAILPANLSYDYRPTLSFNSQSAWLHGAVARSQPQVVAVAEPVAPAPILPVLAGQGFRPVQATIALLEYRPVLTDLADRPQVAAIPVSDYLSGSGYLSAPGYLSVSARSSPRVMGFSR